MINVIRHLTHAPPCRSGKMSYYWKYPTKSWSDMEDSSDQLDLKESLKVEKAFQDLCFKEKFLESSETILKFVSTTFSKYKQGDDDDEAIPKEVEDIIERLLCGLTHKKGLLRDGCYTTLQVLLQLHPKVLPFTVSCIKETFSETKKKPGYKLGHILALGSLIRSGCALDMPDLPRTIVQNLGKKYNLSLSLVAGQFLVNFIVMYSEGHSIKHLWNDLQTSLQGSLNFLSPCLMWLRFILTRDEYKKHLSNVAPNFHKETYDISSFSSVASTFEKLFICNMNVTPMVKDYFESLILFHGKGRQGADNLALFFVEGITPCIQNQNHSPQNIVFILNITQMAFPHLTTLEHIEKVLSKELVELLMPSQKLKSEQVESSARGLMGTILQHLIQNKGSNSEIQLAILKQLLSSPAFLRFDNVTGTTLLSQATEHLNSTTVKGLAKFLSKRVEDVHGNLENPTLSQSNNHLLVSNWLCRMVCHPNFSGSENVKFRVSLLSVLLKFTVMKLPQQTVSAITNAFLRGLIQPTKNLEDLVTVTECILSKARSLVDKRLQGKEAKAYFDKVNDRLMQLKNDKKFPKSHSMVFRVLFGQHMLHLLMDENSSLKLIDELLDCFEMAFKTMRRAEKVERPVPGEEGSSPDWVEFAIKLLLRILSKEENSWRKTVSIMFRHICHSLKPSSLHILTDVIDPEKEVETMCDESEDEEREDSEGDTEEEENELSHSEDDIDDVEDEEEDLVDDNDNDDTNNDDSEEEESEEDDSDADDEWKESLTKLKIEMQKLVGSPLEGAVDMDSVPQEELDNLDQKLGALIRQFITLKNKKSLKRKKQLKTETAQMHFRTRVCDLLETLIEEAPTVDHLAVLIQPLLKALSQFSKDDLWQPLVKRIKSVFEGLGKVKKFARTGTFKTEDLVQQLQFLFNISEQLSDKHNREVELCYTFLIRSGIHLPTEEGNSNNSDALFSTYADHLEAFLNRNCTGIVERPLQLDTPSVAIVLNKLLSLAFQTKFKPLKRKVAIDLIKLVFQNERAISKVSEDVIAGINEELTTNITQTFNAVIRPKQIQTKFLVAVADLLRSLINLHKWNPNLKIGFKWDEIGSALVSFTERVSLTDYKSLKKSFQSLKQIFKTTNSESSQKKEIRSKERKPTKIESDEDEDEDELSVYESDDDESSENDENQIESKKRKLELYKTATIEEKSFKEMRSSKLEAKRGVGEAQEEVPTNSDKRKSLTSQRVEIKKSQNQGKSQIFEKKGKKKKELAKEEKYLGKKLPTKDKSGICNKPQKKSKKWFRKRKETVVTRMERRNAVELENFSFANLIEYE